MKPLLAINAIYPTKHVETPPRTASIVIGATTSTRARCRRIAVSAMVNRAGSRRNSTMPRHGTRSRAHMERRAVRAVTSRNATKERLRIASPVTRSMIHTEGNSDRNARTAMTPERGRSRASITQRRAALHSKGPTQRPAARPAIASRPASASFRKPAPAAIHETTFMRDASAINAALAIRHRPGARRASIMQSKQNFRFRARTQRPPAIRVTVRP